MKKPTMRDEGAAYVRREAAARRNGNRKCPCGESRPEALIHKNGETICAECKRRKDGKSTTDNHHFAGQANSPITIPVPVNDHRAELSTAQADWPEETLRNPNGSPLRAAAACIRGFFDTVVHLIERGLIWVAEALEWLDEYLVARLGPNWWAGTPLERFAGRRPVYARS
jgi:hypothetical protein